jgi:hypothetical protein
LAFDKDCHENAFSPADPNSVTEVVGDGHMKVNVKCVEDPPQRHIGRPAKAIHPNRTKMVGT